MDDASTDGTREWARAQRWPALRYFRLRKNRGTPGARNQAVARARGEFLAFLDHDDLWYSRFLETLVARLRRPGIVMAASNADIIDGRGRLLLKKAGGSSGKIDRVLKSISGLTHTPFTSACVFRSRAVREVGRFDEGFKTMDDLDFFYRLAYRYGPGAIVFVDRALAAYRRHPGQQTSVYREIRESAKLLRALLREGSPTATERACLLDAAYFYAKHAPRLRRLGVLGKG